ncbi:MAG: DegV family protein [Tissierellales bacterium]|jgi:DegV family protein with EDD domain|nr:DegV family protein [Tissierellales bacterium]
MAVKIITDSAADLPYELYDNYGIDVFSINVCLEEREFKDEIEIKSIEVMDYMRSGKVVTTSQVAYVEFKEIFTEYARDKKTCIYIAFSSNLSGTYNTALLAKEEVQEIYPEFDLTIVDSKCATLGQGLVVLNAAILARDGASKGEIIDEIDRKINHMEHIFTVENLEYLYRGGRISKASAVMGSLMKINPIMDVRDGKLQPLEKARGRKKTLKRMVEIVGERGYNLENQEIGINHGDCIDEAHKLRDMIKKEYGTEKFIIREIGSAIGAHTGPGLLGIYFLK